MHARSRPLKHPVAAEFTSKFQPKPLQQSAKVVPALPEEQHDGKRVARRPLKHHPHLDGLLQALAGDVEAVVVYPVALEDTPASRALMEHKRCRDKVVA